MNKESPLHVRLTPVLGSEFCWDWEVRLDHQCLCGGRATCYKEAVEYARDALFECRQRLPRAA